jgi:hypothetical protein
VGEAGLLRKMKVLPALTALGSTPEDRPRLLFVQGSHDVTCHRHWQQIQPFAGRLVAAE